FYCLYLIAITKFSDMGAYLTGSVIGRHPLIPHISPKKTWEGFFGALGFSLLASLALFKLMPGHLAALNWTHATILGLLLGFAAIIRDLAESIVKRSTGVKDSGRLLPGIGGALDLVDSLLFTAPLSFFYLRLVVRVPHDARGSRTSWERTRPRVRSPEFPLRKLRMKRKRLVGPGATASIGHSAA